MNDKYVVNLKNIVKGFNGNPVLKGVDLCLKPGEVLALLGENGAGKSTLMNILMGVYQRDEGTIEINGKQFAHYNIATARENGITIIPQELALVPAITVAENILLGNRIINKAKMILWKDMFEKAQKFIDDFGFKIDARARVDSLPISYRQLVCIIKAVVDEAKVIIMDEPTSSLSKEEVLHLHDIIRKLKAEGEAIIYISHLLDEIFEIADTIVVLRDGCFIDSKNVNDTTQREVVSLMVGEGLMKAQENLRQSIVNEEADYTGLLPRMRVLNFKRASNFKEINFSLYPGEVLGITGLIGAGKSELMRTLIGVDKYDSGTIEIDGQEVKITCPADAYKLGMSSVPEDRKLQGLVLMSSVLDNITLAPVYRKTVTKAGFLDVRQEKKDAANFVEKLVIKINGLNQRAGRLSGGNQQKCVISKALIVKPRILLLDEPTRGIDVGAKTLIYKLIRELKERGISIIFFSSDISEIPIACDRVLLMSNNVFIGELTGKEATVERILNCTIGGSYGKSKDQE